MSPAAFRIGGDDLPGGIERATDGRAAYARSEIRELEAAVAENQVGSKIDTRNLYLGNPNRYPGYEHRGSIRDDEGYLATGHSAREALQRYVDSERPGRVGLGYPGKILLRGMLNIELIYLTEESVPTRLLEEGVTAIERAHESVLPDGFDLTVDVRVETVDDDVKAIVRTVTENKQQAVRKLVDRYVARRSTLPVFVIDPEPLKRYASLLRLELDDIWAGFGTPHGAVTMLPSDALLYGEEAFKQTLVHEIGHTAFRLPHSAVREDVLTTNGDGQGSARYGLPSRLLIERLLSGTLNIRVVHDRSTPRITYELNPALVSPSKAEDAFRANVIAYLQDMVDRFDLDLAAFDRVSQVSRDPATLRFKNYGGDGPSMDVVVGRKIESIRLR